MSPNDLAESQMRFARKVVKPLYALCGVLAVVAFQTGSVFGIPAKMALPATFLLGLPVVFVRVMVDALRTGLIYTKFGMIDRGTKPKAFLACFLLLAGITFGVTAALAFVVGYARTHPEFD